MNEQKILSVIIPVYNQEKYLRCCLDSILTETDCLIEVICVDDGSTDGSGEILEEYKSRYGIKVFHQQNSGVSMARNYGLENATGEFVWFVDSDDFILKGCLGQLVQMLQERHIQVADISWKKVPNEANWTDWQAQKIEYGFIEEMRSSISVCGSIISRKLLEDYHIRFNSKLNFAEDTLFQYYVYLNSKELTRAVVNTPVYFYRQNPTSAMHSMIAEYKRRHTKDLIELGRIYKQEVDSDNIHDEVKLQNTRCRISLSILGALTILPKCDLPKKSVIQMLKSEGLYPYPWIWWHIRDTSGIKAKIVESIKLPFVWEWYYNIYYAVMKALSKS